MSAQAATPAITRVRLSQTADANGNASMTVDGYNVQQPGMWNLFLSVQGSAVVSVLEDGNPISGGASTNGSYDGGPIYTNGNSSLTVNVSGATPNTPVSGVLRGVQSNNPADLVSFVAPGYSTVGASQDNPASLLVGQVGPPLIESETFATRVGGTFSPVFQVSGYSEIFMSCAPLDAPHSNSYQVYVFHLDDNGNQIAQTVVNSVWPGYFGVISLLGTQVQFQFIDPSGAGGSITATVIPLATPVPQASSLIPTTLAGGVSFGPDTRVLMSAQPTIAAGNTATIQANYVWPGQAIVSIGTGGTQLYDCRLFGTDAVGNVIQIARFQNVTGGIVETVQLPSALVTMTFTNNNASAGLTPFLSLFATN